MMFDKPTIDEIVSLASRVAEMEEKEGVKESVYMIEETSETVSELMEFVKNLCKFERKKRLDTDPYWLSRTATDEAIDILTTIVVFLVKNQVSSEHILDFMRDKLRRALWRYEANSEI